MMRDDIPVPASNVPEYTVSEISGALKKQVEDRFAHVRVKGEISGFKRHSSGHLYFALKDADAVLDGVCWKGSAARLGVVPEDGMEIIATGRLTTYPGRSKYQMVVERMELAGQGALLKLLEDRRRKFLAEGLFDPARKRPLPWLPEVIGVVTSPTGAVIRDILHRLSERFPRRVLLWPVAVQGDGAAEQIAAAINGFNRLEAPLRPDVLLVARGGGSIEDLWAFNEEIVVRAAAASTIPLISAVGHETDTTLIDFAADLRAPTPTAAAEKAVPVRADLLATVADLGLRLNRAMNRGLAQRREQVGHRVLPHPRRLLDDKTQRLDERTERLELALRQAVTMRRTALDGRVPRLVQAFRARLQAEAARLDKDALRLDQCQRGLWPGWQRGQAQRQQVVDRLGQMLDSLSYRRVLERGYAVVRNEDGQTLTAREANKNGTILQIEFADGQTSAIVGVKVRAKEKVLSSEPQQGLLL